jgi:hypothetical protein
MSKEELSQYLFGNKHETTPDFILLDVCKNELHECLENSVNWIGKEILSFDICVSAEENNRIYYLNKLIETLSKNGIKE